MSKTKRKKDSNTLEITDDLGSRKYEKSRAEINTAIAHKLLDISHIQIEVAELQVELDLLNL